LVKHGQTPLFHLVRDGAATTGGTRWSLAALAQTRLFKAIILTTLTGTTSATVLLLRLSRLPPSSDAPDQRTYLPSTVVFLTEVVKVVLCLLSVFVTHGKKEPLYDEVRTSHIM
jgi:hypothetical protein